MKVAIFSSRDKLLTLELEINKWLSGNNIEVKYIKQSESMSSMEICRFTISIWYEPLIPVE